MLQTGTKAGNYALLIRRERLERKPQIVEIATLSSLIEGAELCGVLRLAGPRCCL